VVPNRVLREVPALTLMSLLGAPSAAPPPAFELFQELLSAFRPRVVHLIAPRRRAVRDVLKELWNGRTTLIIFPTYCPNTNRLMPPFRIARAAAIAIAIGPRWGGSRHGAGAVGIGPLIVCALRMYLQNTLTCRQGSLGPGSLGNLTRLLGTSPHPSVGVGQGRGTSVW
jgi:hypothetical protein